MLKCTKHKKYKSTKIKKTLQRQLLDKKCKTQKEQKNKIALARSAQLYRGR